MKAGTRNPTTRALLAGMLSVVLAACGQSSGGGHSGGAQGSGGATSSGGSGAGSGGAREGSGGTISTGGTSASGGAPGSGGAVGSGGSKGSGGIEGTGGATPVGSGGRNAGGINAGGSLGAGGTGSGGTSVSAGGAGGKGSGGAATGGGPGTGGGGSSATGGSTAAGGTTGAGGGGPDAGRDSGTVGSGGTGGGGADGGSGGGTGSAVCPTPALKSGDSTKKITVGSLNREYILHVPSGYTGSTAVPLVLDFHPLGGSDSSWRSGSPYPAVIDKENVISAFPNGESGPSGQAWNVEGCCVSKINGADVDDVAFAKAVVADIEKVACIDAKRVYAVGFSMGGGMSNYLACHAADVFAAVGPASFDLTQQNEGDCTPARPLTVIEWRGKNDTVVPYAGGHSAVVSGMAIDFLGAVGTFQKWASLDGCTGNPGAADSNNCQTYSQCGAGVQVTLCTDNNGGHEAANANVVWPMLKKYTMP